MWEWRKPEFERRENDANVSPHNIQYYGSMATTYEGENPSFEGGGNIELLSTEKKREENTYTNYSLFESGWHLLYLLK